MPQRMRGYEAFQRMKESGVIPLVPYPGAKMPWLCRCGTCGKDTSPRLQNVMRGQRACKYCSGANVRSTEAEATADMLARGLEPVVPFPGNNKAPWLSRCLACDATISPRLNDVRSGKGCRECGRVKGGVKGRKTQEEAFAIAQAAHLEPLEPYSTSVTPWRCRCLSCGREVRPLPNSLQQGRSGCWPCAQADRIARLAKNAEPGAIELMRKALLEPLHPYKNNSTPWRCRCLNCGREVSPTYLNVSQGQGGCGYCSRNRVDPAAAVALMRTSRLEPKEGFPGVEARWLCECLKCHRLVRPSFGNIRSGQGGCAWCALRGFDPAAVTDLYLITNAFFVCHKIGITKKGSSRLANFQRQGWEIFKSRRFPNGLAAYEAEQAALSYIRGELGLPRYLSKNEMRNGWTETVCADSVGLVELWEIVSAICESTEIRQN